MVTTESLVDSVMSRWFFIELPNSSKSFLGLFSGSLTYVPMRGDCLTRPLRKAQCAGPENSCPLTRKCRFDPTVHDRGLMRIDPKQRPVLRATKPVEPKGGDPDPLKPPCPPSKIAPGPYRLWRWHTTAV